MTKRLYRSRDNKIIGGLIGGMGEYFDVDPTILRVLFLALFIFTGIIPGFIFYIFALLIVSKKPH